MRKTQAQKCLDQINAYYADDTETQDRYERNADNVWGDVILDADGYDDNDTEAQDPGGNSSTVAVFKDGSELIWDEPTQEWEAY